MAMSTQELMAILLPTLGNGIISGVNSNQQRSQQMNQQMQDNIQRQLMALQNSQQTSQQLQSNRQNMAQAGLNASPLGQEQAYVQRARLMQAMLPMAAGFQPAGPSDPAIAGTIRQGTNPLEMFGDPRLQETFSDQMTGQALADRRRALAGVNPDFEFGSLGAYGMDPGLDAGVQRAQDAASRRLSAYENTQASLAQQQLDLARQQQQQAVSGQQKSNGGGFLGALGGILRTAAPFASLIPGVGPGLALGLGAAGSALGTRLQGGSMMDSIISGGMTAGMGALANRAQTGSWRGSPSAGPQLNNQMSAQSLPLPSMPMGGPGPQLQGPAPQFSIPQPYNASGDVLRQIQSLAPPSRPSAPRPPQPPPQPPPPAQGMNPQFGYPMRDALPYNGPPPRLPGQGTDGSLPQIGAGRPGETNQWAFRESLQQQPLVRALQTPIGAMMAGGIGASIPAAAGAMAAPAPPASNIALRPGAMTPWNPQPIAQMQMGANASTAARNQAFEQMWKQAMSRANYTDQQNMLNIIRAAQQPGVDAGAMISSPEAQTIMRRILGGR